MALTYQLAGTYLSNNVPQLNENKTKYIFNQQVVVKIENAPVGKFEQVDNTTFEVTIATFDPLLMDQYSTDAALVYIQETYTNS